MAALTTTPISKAGTLKADDGPARSLTFTGPNCRRAFTFIEVIVALAVVSVGLLGLLHLHVLSVRAAASSKTRTQAVLLAQEKMAVALATARPERAAQSGEARVNGVTYKWRTEVTNAVSSQLDLNALRKLRVRVTWDETSARGGVDMTTYLADSKLHE
jgi:type II secretion system protein I